MAPSRRTKQHEPGEPADSRPTRRTALTALGLGAGGLVLAGAGVVGVRGALNGVWTSGQGDPYELWSAWPTLTGLDAIVAAGVLAANPHNTQGWRFHVDGADADGAVIEVRDDASRRMPVTDPFSREHRAGLGCAVENVVTAARGQGVGAEVELLPEASDPEFIARISLAASAAPGTLDRARAGAIAERHTNRGPFAPGPVDPADLAALEALGDDRARLVLVTDAANRTALGDLYVRATEGIVADDEQSVEAFAWFRNDRADVDRYRDGLTLDAQGLDAFTLAMAKLLPATSRTKGDAFWVSSTRDTHTATAAAYGVIVVHDALDPAAQVAGGRLLQRLHLEATRLGLAFHHMNQVTERIDRARATGAVDAYSDEWAALIGAPAAQGLVAFRLGHPERAPRPSPRRALADVVTT
ncbi:hypothetical protein ARHIZOSPH14_08170 [Agromyces rhizosphaerae]|uniref:Nitroreductase domain-containing protein n=1 Tax=Agromyces rhizosphaerae TaxID=88374 RepID=A0A9W6CUE3_9MICO|nr:hypothetical protein [Agromyces rhizosphaerae]GLI26575.1 hypothetical protein ARHIZOSPH14_08170 [Agromyces rhizosphaerae]